MPSSEGYLGDMVAWTFGDGIGSEFSAPRHLVKQIFDKAGFDPEEMLEDGDVGRMLAWAPTSGGIVLGRGHFVRPFARPNKDTPVALGVYERTAIRGEAGDDWQPGARVRVVNGWAQEMAPEGLAPIPGCMVVAQKIAARANHLVANVCNQELSKALVRAGHECHWSLFRRGTGGAYWMPPTSAERYRALLDELEKFGGFFPIVQPLFGDSDGRTSANVHQAALASLMAELAEVQGDLEKAEGYKTKTIEARIDHCRAIVIRANLYAQALRGDLQGVLADIEKVSSEYQKLLDYSDEESAFGQAVGQ